MYRTTFHITDSRTLKNYRLSDANKVCFHHISGQTPVGQLFSHQKCLFHGVSWSRFLLKDSFTKLSLLPRNLGSKFQFTCRKRLLELESSPWESVFFTDSTLLKKITISDHQQILILERWSRDTSEFRVLFFNRIWFQQPPWAPKRVFVALVSCLTPSYIDF